MTSSQIIKSCQRKIAEMLVIDGVEFATFNHVFDVRDLDHCLAVVFQNDKQSGNEIVQVGRVRQDVISVHDVSELIFTPELLRQALAKKFADRRNAALHSSNLGDI